MEQERFDELTRKLASPVTRKTALKAVVATTLGGAFSLTGLSRAGACKANGDKCEHDHQCCSGNCPPVPNPKGTKYCAALGPPCEGTCTGGTCFSGFPSCGPSCFCYTTESGAGGCGPSVLCAGIPTCNVDSDCASGGFCAVNTGCNCGTGGGVCIPCGTCAADNPIPRAAVIGGPTSANT